MSDEIVGDLQDVEGLLGYPDCLLVELPDYIEIRRNGSLLFRMSYRTMVKLLKDTMISTAEVAHLVGYLVHDGEIDPLITACVDDPHGYIDSSVIRKYIVDMEQGKVSLS